MIRRNLDLALRRLRRGTGYAVLNVVGLAVGLAVCGVLLLFVRHETSYEGMHAHADRIHLVRAEGMFAGQTMSSVMLPAPIGPALRDGLPEVEQVVRVRLAPPFRLRRGDELHEVQGLHFVDPEVFDVFSFDFIAGDPVTALSDPATMVLDRSFAGDVFGALPPHDLIGRSVELDVGTFRVTGVMADVAQTTHWRPRALLSTVGSIPAGPEALHDAAYRTYLLLRRGLDAEATVAKVPAALQPVVAGTIHGEQSYHFTPIERIHLHGYGTVGPRGSGIERALTEPSVARLRIFGIVALLILLLASINYVNLATAAGLARARAVGVCKVLGATRLQLSGQMLAESALVALAAGIVAIGFVALGLGPFGDAVRADIALRAAEWVMLAALFLCLSVVVGILAGLYPALALTRAQPSEAFRANVPSGLGGRRVRHALVVLQFGISITLVVATMVMTRQVGFMQADHGGIEPSNVLAVQFPQGFGEGRFDAVAGEIEAHPGVAGTAAMLWSPFARARAFMPITFADGRPPVTTNWYAIEPKVRSLLGMELVTGDDLPQTWSRSDATPLLMNETAAAALGWTLEEAVGHDVTYGYQDAIGRVVGVIRDFHYASLREPIEPQLFESAAPQQRTTLLVRFDARETAEVLASVRRAWDAVAPDEPLRTHYLDETYAALYDSERRLAGLFGAFGVVAILIAALGLLGLSAFTAQKRRSEVSIRKVLGASEASVVRLLTGDFARLVLIALAVATPVSYWMMSRWLGGFAYHIRLGPDVFLLAGGGAMVIAVLTVAYHALRAAVIDPVEALRTD